MEYIGTILIAIIALEIGYVWGRLHERNNEKEIRTLAGRLAEAVLFAWDNVADIARQMAVELDKWRYGK